MHVVEVRSGEGAAHKTRGSGQGIWCRRAGGHSPVLCSNVPSRGFVVRVRPRPAVSVQPTDSKSSSPLRNSLPGGDGERDSWLMTSASSFFSCLSFASARLASSHLISSQCQSHCVSYHPGHRTLVYNLKTSNIFSLRPPLLVLGCPTPACPKDQVVAWCCSVHSVCAFLPR